jgi:hypothetical protein
MARKKKQEPLIHVHWEMSPEIRRTLIAIALMAVGVIGALAYFGSAGILGYYINRGLGAAFGADRLLFPVILVGFGLITLIKGRVRSSMLLGFFIFIR